MSWREFLIKIFLRSSARDEMYSNGADIVGYGALVILLLLCIQGAVLGSTPGG